MNANILQSYKSASLATDCKITPVILLYETAIKSVNKAIRAIEDADIEGRFNSIKHATDIILGLKMALDFEDINTRKLSAILNDFYIRIEKKLNQIQKNNDINLCSEVLQDLAAMKESWEFVRTQNESQENPQTQAANENIASFNQSF